MPQGDSFVCQVNTDSINTTSKLLQHVRREEVVIHEKTAWSPVVSQKLQE